MRRPDERLAPFGLGTLLLLSALLTLFLGRDLTFFSDELGWLTFADDLEPESILAPHNSHLIALPRLLYEVLPQLFGTSYFPFRIVALGAVLASGALFHALARERVGAWEALAPTALLLFFGSAPVIALSPLAIPFTLSIAFGLAALLAVERSRPAAVCALLAVSILSHTFGVIFAGGVLIHLLVSRRIRDGWIAAIPIGLWVGWWAWAQQFDQGITEASNLGGAPAFVVEAAAAALAALVGAPPDLGGGVIGTVLIVAAVVLGAGLLMRAIRRGRGTPWLWAYLAMAGAFWLGIAMSEAADRQPETPRYLFFGALMLLLVAVEALRGVELGRPARLALAALLAVGLVANGARLVNGATDLTSQADDVGVQLAMLELAGASANPGFAPRDVAPRGSDGIAVPAGMLAGFSDDVGELGLPLEDVRGQSEPRRRDADFVLARALGLLAVPAQPLNLGIGAGCREVGSAGEEVRVELEPGGNLLRLTEGASQPLLVGRFADAASAPVGELGAEEVALHLPEDGAPEPWFATVRGTVRLCPFVQEG